MYSPELPPTMEYENALSPPSSDSFEFNIGKEGDQDRNKKRQVRLLKNRQSAALSRTRKKDYIQNLESKAQELQISTHELNQNRSLLVKKTQESKMKIEFLEKQLLKVVNENDTLKSKLSDKNNTINQNNNQNNNTINQNNLSKPSREGSNVIIGINKMNHFKQQQQQQQKELGILSTVIDEEISLVNNLSNNSNSHSIVSPHLSISNPNVNSAPTYLSRARASSYHPTNETYSSQSLQHQQQQQTQSPIVLLKKDHDMSSSPAPTSHLLPSLSQLIPNIVVQPPATQFNAFGAGRPNTSITPSGTSPTRKNMLGYYHFTQPTQSTISINNNSQH